MKNEKSTIIIESSEDDQWATEVWLFLSNGTWSGGLTLYLNNQDIITWYEQLLEYGGKWGEIITFQEGQPDNEEAAYYAQIVVQPTDHSGHSSISVHLIENGQAYGGKVYKCEFDIRCVPADIIQLGKLIKKSYNNKSYEKWEIVNNQ